MPIAHHTIHDFFEGQGFSFTKTIAPEDIDAFARVSGDLSPVHMSEAFAKECGFQGRVVHGALLVSYISQMVGVHFPGGNCLLNSLNVKFHSPCFVGDTVEIRAKVDQISDGVNVILLEITVENVKTRTILARSKVQVSFLKVN
jgi:3-hydroxybutyryl-CoA dehydratase